MNIKQTLLKTSAILALCAFSSTSSATILSIGDMASFSSAAKISSIILLIPAFEPNVEMHRRSPWIDSTLLWVSYWT